MDNKVTLGYWAIRGLSERIRMVLEFVGLEYNQKLFTASNRDEWFNETKPKLIEKNPAITLPYLLDGEEVISESDAIIVYVCHKANRADLLGRNATEQTRVATAMGVIRDLHGKYIGLVYGRDNANLSFEEAKAATLPVFQPYLTKLNQMLEGRDFIAGEITWVDFVLAEFMQCLWILQKDFLEGFANIWAHQKRVWELPAIKAYHETDRFKEVPLNNAPPARWSGV